jgi:hypothetical protein
VWNISGKTVTPPAARHTTSTSPYGAGTLNTVPFQGTKINKPDMFNLNHSPPQHQNQKSGNINL